MGTNSFTTLVRKKLNNKRTKKCGHIFFNIVFLNPVYIT